MANPRAPNSVIIIGGSLSGLMHALTLLSLPKPPSKLLILERSPTSLLHNQGAGIVFGSETQHFFEHFVRPGRPISVKSPLRHYLDRDGGVLEGSVDYWEQRMTSWDLLFHLLRWRVDGLQSPYVEDLEADGRANKRAYENGCTVTGVRDLGERVEVKWVDAEGGERTEDAEMVIAADGGSSKVRSLLLPDVERKYAGYVAWRGAITESELSEEAKEAFVEKFTFYHREGLQILGYLIPAPPNGNLESGERRFNWVWYRNYEEGSSELEELMTDINGKRHPITLPVGKIQHQVWEKQKKYADEVLPPQFAEAVSKTQQPFIQAITDVVSPTNTFFGGKGLFVGDALAGFRPHTAASTSQAAFDAIHLDQWLRGETAKKQYDRNVMEYAVKVQRHGVNLGNRSQFGLHPQNG